MMQPTMGMVRGGSPGQARPWQLASECLGQRNGAVHHGIYSRRQYGCCTVPLTPTADAHLISGLFCVPSFIIFSIHAAVKKKPILVDQITLYTHLPVYSSQCINYVIRIFEAIFTNEKIETG